MVAHRPGNRSADSAHRPREGKDRPGPQAEDAPARGRTSPTKYPVGTVVKGTVVNVMSYGAFVKLEEGIEGLVHISEMSWTKRISHPSELVHIDERSRSRGPRHQQGEARNLAGHEADPGEPVGQGRRPLSARRDGQRHGPQPHQLRRLHRDRRRHRRPAARQRHVVDPQDQPSQRSGRKGPGSRVQGALASIRSAAASPWASSSWTKIPGRPTSRAGTSRASSSRARSRRSPTSASSSAWRTASKACCTSRSWPTTRSRTPRTSSKSATRSRSRSCASMPTSGRSACRASASNGPRKRAAAKTALGRRRRLERPSAELKGGVGAGTGPLFKSAAPAREAGRIVADRGLQAVLAIRHNRRRHGALATCGAVFFGTCATRRTFRARRTYLVRRRSVQSLPRR